MSRLAMLSVASVFFLASCGAQQQEVGEMQHKSRSIQPQDAKSVRAHLVMGSGELNLSGGADALMEGDFSYNVSEWKPEVNYEVKGDRGELSVEQGKGGKGVRPGGDARNEWDVSLNDGVPTDLRVEMGAGRSDLNLDDLTLTGLDLQMGAGETRVDLSGDYDRDFDATIQGGVGEATIMLPSKVGVRAKAEGGLGEINTRGLTKEGNAYVNDAYQDADVTLEVDVEGGVGEINLKVV